MRHPVRIHWWSPFRFIIVETSDPMNLIPKPALGRVAQVVIAASFAAMLAACASSPLPVTETKPAPGTPAVGSGPLWTRQLISGNFRCEFGSAVGIKMGDGLQNVNLTWKGKTYVMLPVKTATGALRFEDRSSGMVWIQIPAKSMLLDSKIGQPLANDCKL
jgi:hypothetical protein